MKCHRTDCSSLLCTCHRHQEHSSQSSTKGSIVARKGYSKSPAAADVAAGSIVPSKFRYSGKVVAGTAAAAAAVGIAAAASGIAVADATVECLRVGSFAWMAEAHIWSRAGKTM